MVSHLAQDICLIKTQCDLETKLTEAGDQLVIIFYTSEWCGPAKVMAPNVKKYSEEFTDVVFLQVDVEQADNSVAHYFGAAEAMPCNIAVRQSKEVARHTGANITGLRDLITNHKE